MKRLLRLALGPALRHTSLAAKIGPQVTSPRRRIRQQAKNDGVPETLAADCVSMPQVRAEIDRIDRLLVALVAERQGYIEAAARIKEHAGEVRLQWRIDDVLGKVLVSAEREGLSKRIAEPVWRELIDRCIDHEHEMWRSFHKRNEK